MPASEILMIRPSAFGSNLETLDSNAFQDGSMPNDSQIASALQEFDSAVEILRQIRIKVHVFQDTALPPKPDAVFPNNWFCTLPSGALMTFPMLAGSRRNERREDIMHYLAELGYGPRMYLEQNEVGESPRFLEGTGSIVFDHDSKVAYMAESHRSNVSLMKQLGAIIDYHPCIFQTKGPDERPIYHTNVMMCVGATFVLIATGCIASTDRSRVLKTISETGKTIIEITNDQCFKHFAGNMIQLANDEGEAVLVLSASALASLNNDQKQLLSKHNDHLIEIAIPTIERFGGGSIRCMIAELHPISGKPLHSS